MLAAGAILITLRNQIGELYDKIYKVKRFDTVVGLSGVISAAWGALLVFFEL